MTFVEAVHADFCIKFYTTVNYENINFIIKFLFKYI